MLDCAGIIWPYAYGAVSAPGRPKPPGVAVSGVRLMARLATMKPRLSTTPFRLKVAPKEVEPHYQSPEHREWRAAVIKRAGGICQGRGCGRSDTRLFADHIVELKDGGAPLALSNGQALCGACHQAKTARARAKRMAGPY